MSDIVNREQIKKFFDTLKLEYDYVIIDSPPVQPVSDTLILAQATDYNLFLIRSEQTRTVTYLSAIKKIQNVGSKIQDNYNDLDTSKDSYYSYYYNYGQSYYNYYSSKSTYKCLDLKKFYKMTTQLMLFCKNNKIFCYFFNFYIYSILEKILFMKF